jgi:hypothetical protein
MLQFTTLRAAAAGVPILPFFDYQRGLVDLVTRRSRYVPDWVRVFYATVDVDTDRVAIRFMFVGRCRGSLERGSQSCFRWIYTMILFTTWHSPTLSLLVAHTHLSYLPTRRSVSCSSSLSFPAHLGHQIV